MRQHRTDQKQMGLLREQCAELRKGHLQYCCSQVWMKNGGQILWNVLPICETFKISCLMGRLHTKDVLENLFKGPIIPFGSLVEYYTISAKDQSRIHQFGKKVSLGLFLGYALCAGGFGRVICWLQTLRNWKRWTHQKSIYCKRLNAKEVVFPKENGKIHFSRRRWTNKICWGRSGVENIHLDTGSPNSRRRSKRFSWRIRRVSSTTLTTHFPMPVKR